MSEALVIHDRPGNATTATERKRVESKWGVHTITLALVAFLSLHGSSRGQFAHLEWSWTSSTTLPTSLNVLATPAVADLDLDGSPEIIFSTSSTTSGIDCQAGNLRAIRGGNGAAVFTNTSHQVIYDASPSVGDIDGDGFPEIVTVAASGNQLVAFEHTGVFKWISPQLELLCGSSASIADLDGDGSPEIVIGRQVLANTGQLLWTGTGSAGGWFTDFKLSHVADIDGDGAPDIVAGNTVYSRTGSIIWHQAGIPTDGYTAVADFDGDFLPEIALVQVCQLWMLEHNGAIKWGPVPIPGCGGGGYGGGPPTVADFDGDGVPEIGISAAVLYTVFEPTGAVRWSASMLDASGLGCSAAFDFDGDGAFEIVHHSDNSTFRIFNGSTGAVLFSTPLGSGTLWEYPVVADVDGDGQAEVIVGANNAGNSSGPGRGIYVYGSNGSSWAPARKVWNQHTYHVTNVENAGGIPPHEQNSWISGNTFRAQVAHLQLIPAVSTWGLVVLLLGLATAGTCVLRRSRLA